MVEKKNPKTKNPTVFLGLFNKSCKVQHRWLNSQPSASTWNNIHTHSTKLCSFQFGFPSDTPMGEKNLFISSSKALVNFFWKLVGNPFSPLGCRTVTSFTWHLQLWNTWTEKPVFGICQKQECFYFFLVSMCLQSSWEGLFFSVCVWLKEKRATGVKGEKDIICIFKFYFRLFFFFFFRMVNVKSILWSATYHFLWFLLFFVFPLRSTVSNFLIYLYADFFFLVQNHFSNSCFLWGWW